MIFRSEARKRLARWPLAVSNFLLSSSRGTVFRKNSSQSGREPRAERGATRSRSQDKLNKSSRAQERTAVQRFYGSLPPLSGRTARIVTRECKFVSGKPQQVQVGARRINHARHQDAERPSDRPGSLQAALVFMCQNRHISDALLNIKATRRVVHALPSFAAAAPSIKHTNAPRAVSLAPTRMRARVCDFRCARVLEGEARWGRLSR